MVTAGANQAFANVVLALLDATDRCVLFKPVRACMGGGAVWVHFGGGGLRERAGAALLPSASAWPHCPARDSATQCRPPSWLAVLLRPPHCSFLLDFHSIAVFSVLPCFP